MKRRTPFEKGKCVPLLTNLEDKKPVVCPHWKQNSTKHQTHSSTQKDETCIFHPNPSDRLLKRDRATSKPDTAAEPSLPCVSPNRSRSTHNTL